MHGVLDAFAAAFEDPASYSGSRPSPGYLSRLLASETFVCLAAIDDGEVIGGLTAYELIKFEQERSEIYIFDLGVLSSHRRRGVAKRLIEALRSIARSRKASVVFVQADHDDDPAITLYASLGKGREILHFDISTD
jgi:aminoglycoside 3-N-acetyltransferase I